MLFAADFLGKSGNVRVKELATGRPDLIAAYAAYEGGNLARVAIINFKEWHRGQDRESVPVTIGVPQNVQQVTVRRLTTTAGALNMNPHNVTWAGEVWTNANNGTRKVVGQVSQKVQVNGKNARVNISATGAVIVDI